MVLKFHPDRFHPLNQAVVQQIGRTLLGIQGLANHGSHVVSLAPLYAL